MRKRLPFQITAQVVAVLTFKKLTVHTEQGSQQLTTDRKRINIILLKKTQTHASYGCLPLPVSSYGLRNAPRLSKSTAPADIQEKILATDGEVPDYYRVVEAFAFHFDSRIFTGKLIFLFQVNHDFTTAFLYSGNVEIIQGTFGKKETVTVSSIIADDSFVSHKDRILSDIPLRILR